MTGAGSALAFFVVCVCLIGAWQLRNRTQCGYSGFSSISAINLYFYNSAAVQAKLEGRPFYEEQKRRGYHDRSQYYLQYPEQREWSEPRQLSFMARDGAKLIGENWPLYAGIHLSGMLRCLLDPGAVEYLRAFGRYPNLGGLLGRLVDEGFFKTALAMRGDSPGLFWLNIVMGAFLLLVLGGVAPGIIRSLRQCRWVTLLILLTLFYLLLISGGPAALSRFRVPLMPIFVLFSGLGLERGLNWRIFRFGRRPSPSLR